RAARPSGPSTPWPTPSRSGPARSSASAPPAAAAGAPPWTDPTTRSHATSAGARSAWPAPATTTPWSSPAPPTSHGSTSPPPTPSGPPAGPPAPAASRSSTAAPAMPCLPGSHPLISINLPGYGDAVTALAAEADSFSGDVRLTRAQPGPGRDVICPVTVGVLLAAGGTDDGVLPWPDASRTAGVTVEAGVAGFHPDPSSSGALSLGDEDAGELSPAGVQDRPVEPGLLRHVPPGPFNGATSGGGQAANSQVLQRQHIVRVNQGAGGLVVEVAPLVADLAPFPGTRPPEPPAVARAERGAFLSALQTGNTCLCGGEEPRVRDDDTVARGEEPRHPDVDADRVATGWERLGVCFGANDHVPAAAFPFELQRLPPPCDRAMLPDLEVPDGLEARARPVTGAGRHPFSAVPGDKPHLVESLVRLEPRGTHPAPPRLWAPEDDTRGCIQAAEGLLLGSAGMPSLPRQVVLPDLSKLRALAVEADRDVALAPGIAPLLEGGVVQIAVVAQQSNGATLLRHRRVGTELVGASHDTWPSRPRAASAEDLPSLIDRMPPACRRHMTFSVGAAP